MSAKKEHCGLIRGSLLIIAVMLASIGAPLRGEGFRDIASLTVDAYFDDTWRVTSENVFLARLAPGFSVQAKLERIDTQDFFEHRVYLGPVVNFTDSLYLDAVYGIGVNSANELSHKAEANLTHETDELVAAVGLRFEAFPSTDYFYFLPSAGGKIKLTEHLGFFGKAFISRDSENKNTGSFWGEADWAFSPDFTARAGFTLSFAGGIGYSILAGATLRFNPDVSLKYNFQYLSDTVEYQEIPQTKTGIENALILDVSF